jgi:hypothetical protein
MTPAELRNHGERLYGPRWQSKLAGALGVTPRSVRYWLSGKHQIREPMAKLIRLL